MKRIAIALVLLIAVGVTLVAHGVFDPRPFRNAPGPSESLLWSPSIEIAPLSQALTFARIGEGDQARLVGVTGYEEGVVTGTTLETLPSEDPISLIARLGYDGVRTAIETGTQNITRPVQVLAIPIDLGHEHIAAGTNYAEHADQSDVESGPFLFPKYVKPTGARAPIPAGEGLLDYEVELCLVTLSPLAPGDGASGGLILCNDITDRAVLLRHIDPDDPGSGKGFTSGKSAPGFLPVGDLFVVPADLDEFVKGMELRLSVNGELRQQAEVSQWIWDLDRILVEAEKKRGVDWAYGKSISRLPFTDEGLVPARTLVLAGTPSGTVFQGIYPSAIVNGALAWIAGGWEKPFTRHVIEAHIRAARCYGDYLQPGDRVETTVDRMGTLSNPVR